MLKNASFQIGVFFIVLALFFIVRAQYAPYTSAKGVLVEPWFAYTTAGVLLGIAAALIGSAWKHRKQ
jgi:hypothetical protein